MLEISSSIVGLKFKPYSTQVQWRHTTNYAASVGDANEWYLDDTKEEGIIAPPMFAVAITWPLVERINEYPEWPYPPDLLRTIVHYSEHLQFKRPIRPGDRLGIHGEIAAVLPHRAGAYLVLKFRAVSETGEMVFTEYTGGMLRGVKCTDVGRGGEGLPWLAPLAIPENPIWTTSIPIAVIAPIDMRLKGRREGNHIKTFEIFLGVFLNMSYKKKELLFDLSNNRIRLINMTKMLA